MLLLLLAGLLEDDDTPANPRVILSSVRMVDRRPVVRPIDPTLSVREPS